MHGYLTNAARVNTPPLGAFQYPCPAACGGVIDWDVLVVDEAHEGVDTYKTDVAFDHIKRKFTVKVRRRIGGISSGLLCASGTR